MQTWKSHNIFVFIKKWYTKDSTLRHLLIIETCICEIHEMFAYKHSETREYIKNSLIYELHT